MPNEFRRGTGRGFRGGMGFGFRGSSPPWPYIGRGRGGLPRCGYFANGTADNYVPQWGYQQPEYAPGTGTSSASAATPEQELDSLRNQAKAMKEQMEQIEARIRELGNEA